jgi:hypothetical protein
MIQFHEVEQEMLAKLVQSGPICMGGLTDRYNDTNTSCSICINGKNSICLARRMRWQKAGKFLHISGFNFDLHYRSLKGVTYEQCHFTGR